MKKNRLYAAKIMWPDILKEAVEHRHRYKPEKSIKKLASILEIADCRHSALVELGLAKRDMGLFQESNQHFYESLAEYSDSNWARIHLGVNYRLQDLIDKSIRTLTAAIEIAPSNIYAKLELCLSYIKNKKLEKAGEQLNIIRSLEPDFESADYIEFIIGLIKKDWLLVKNSLSNMKNDSDSDALSAIYKMCSNDIAYNDSDWKVIYEQPALVVQKINELLRVGAIDEKFSCRDELDVGINSIIENSIPLVDVYNKIFDFIDSKKPCSIIRISDGEGIIYDYMKSLVFNPKYNHDSIHNFLLANYMWKRWFGRAINTEDGESLIRFYKLFSEAVENASILCFTPNIEDLYYSYASYHGSKSASLLSELNKNNKYLSSILPEDLFEKTDFFERLFVEGRRISIISCHPKIADYLKGMGVNIKQNLVVPWHRSHTDIFGYEENNRSHYVDCFDKIISSIEVDCDLYLVAAGVLGKVYCEVIRSRGGRAFDLGALADAFAGFNTRNSIWEKWAAKPLWENNSKNCD